MSRKSLAGRIYIGEQGNSAITVSFDNDGFAKVVANNRSEVFCYETESSGLIIVYVASRPAEEYKWKYDDDSLMLVWWPLDGGAMILDRADAGKSNSSKKTKQSKKGIEGRIFQKYDGYFVTISFEKFGLAHLTIDDETESLFYTDDTKARKVCLREEYNAEFAKDIITLNYDDDTLWGIYDDEEIVLENLDRKIAANLAARASSYEKNDSSSSKKKSDSARELTPPKETHTQTYDTLVRYGFRTSEGTIESDYIRISKSHLRPDELGIIGIFLHDDGTNCFLDRKNITFDGRTHNLKSPKHLNITGCIKEILYAKEGSVLRYALVLIECKESNTQNVLLQNIYGKNMFGGFVQDKVFAEVNKGFSLEENSSELMNYLKNNNDFYYSDNLQWFIETY